MEYVVIIPARYSSTRFPGKPLAMLGGKPVVQHVYDKASSVIPDVYVATDDECIFDAVRQFGGKAVMTRSDHKSGTDRIKEAADIVNRTEGKTFDVVVNVQGDEPFIDASQIETVCRQFDDATTQIATLGKLFADMDSADNPNSPKIVIDNRGFAMYFSRSVIPFVRGIEHAEWLSSYPFVKHIGIYAYRTHVLSEITSLPQSSLEIAESLEQLRWLQNGYRIRVGMTDIETIGIDTPEDLEKAERYLASHPSITTI
jgi:3-deoxy-manno-octulosonate cytidylyltransferase (CMP-KDO synthetase)